MLAHRPILALPLRLCARLGPWSVADRWLPLRLLLQGLPGVCGFLERPDVLDAAGGLDIFQMPAGRVTLSAGADAVRCISFSGKVLRWYTDCCRTPMANTAASPRFPVVGLIHSFMDHEPGGRSRDEVLGAPLCRIYERSATGPLPPDAPAPPSLAVFARRTAKILGWWARGLGRPHPFFDARSGAPLSAPRVLMSSERAAL